LCARDDGLVVEICEEYGIPHTRTLRLLSEMVETGHKTAAEVMAMADMLVNERGKRIRPAILDSWKRNFQ
jgi:hypothetical protein